MECPYCGGELTSGQVSAPASTFEFYPEGVKPRAFRTRWGHTKGAVTIRDFRMFGKGAMRGYFCPARYCPNCRKIFLDLAETDGGRPTARERGEGGRMLTHKTTKKEIAAWKKVFEAYRGKLKPNRRSGEALAAYLVARYPVRQLLDERALSVVRGNVEDNDCFKEKLRAGESPRPAAFLVENTGAGKTLYADKSDSPVFSGAKEIFVGVDLATGYFCVEGSEALYDELFAYRGLDEKDLTNFYLVAQYVAAAKI